ncbi:hypothetical protein FMUND_11223 [Fusarium mundagurra]|uniref:Fungal N-terminal domain-containing protein n=1 Tax=Fusarium mundagurra TaxID=1567541 RepID=A0A8H5Y7P2_9HYPO|nr:hypothetical protein FMUND_11223 [Fusarium mundagurra]
MGDPLSIASGVAGLVSLGLTVCDGLHTYFSAIKDRKDDLAIVTQNLALFKFHIFAVQSSASKLGHRHSPAIDGLQLSLINCEMQLKCLESLLNELMPAENPSLAKEIWRRQKMIARYPFDRKKLVQLEEYLSRANITLSSFIQALNLLDFISPKVEPSNLQVVPSGEEDVTASSSNSIVLHQTVMGAETKSCSPKNKRAFEDLTDSHYTPRYLQNAKIERTLCKKLADMNCTCGASKSQTSNRPASRTYRFWGGLTVSRQGDPCNIVKSSPAFKLFDKYSQRYNEILDPYANENGLDHLAESLITGLRVIYGSGKASPLDVDQDDVGFSELFLAVITKDHRRLQAILAEDSKILNISQTDLYGRNILHASCNWPDGLKLLLQRQDALPLMEMAPEAFSSLSPLDYALFYSKIYCKAPDQWTECDDCTCYVAVKLLLEANCKVTITYKRSESLASCSLKARRLFFKHLKDRRQRLRNLALSILPENVLCQYGVVTSPLPDKTAVLLWSELRQAQDQQDRQVWLPHSLDPCNDGPSITPGSLFEFPHHLQVAELAVDYGFAPRDENGVETLLSGTNILPHYLSMRSEAFMEYLDWLLQYDLNLELSLEPFQFSILHRLATSIGNLISFSSSGAQASVLTQWDDSMGNEDWKEILDEDRELINQLEALDEKFADVFDRQNVSIAEFLQGYWLTTMEEVLGELNRPLTDYNRYELQEAGVMLGEDDKHCFECCIKYTKDEP